MDNFWAEFKNVIELRQFPGVYMSQTLEDACDVLRSDTRVNAGYLLEESSHTIYWFKFRDSDWHHFMKNYWWFEDDSRYPTSEQVDYIVCRVTQAASNLTLASRLKNDSLINEGKGANELIDEVKAAKLIGDRYFDGTFIAKPDDIPMWAIVHFLQYYCATQTVVSMILHNRTVQMAEGRTYMHDRDFAVLEGLKSECAQKLPVLEAIKENGWNVFYAEAVDPSGGNYKHHRDRRLDCLREWSTWINNPYDEQRGTMHVPQERRGRCYQFSEEKDDEYRTPNHVRWPSWTQPIYLDRYIQKYVGGTSTVPPRIDPRIAPGAEGSSGAQHAFLDPRQNATIPSPIPGEIFSTAQNYTVENDPWNTTVVEPPTTTGERKEQDTTPKATKVPKELLPPMIYDPATESADEDVVDEDEEWVYPTLPTGLQYARYTKAGRTLADRVKGGGSAKLLVQPSFSLKPMIDEAVPSKSIKSTYACYLRKVTSYIAVWSGCTPAINVLRKYRLRDDADWIRLYNYCLDVARLRNAHLLLSAKDLAALCGVLPDMEVVRPIVKTITSQRFLNDAAVSSGNEQVAAGVRLASTGLFTDFDVTRKSNAGNRINIHRALGDHFAWANIYHVSVEVNDPQFKCQCLEVIHNARKYLNVLMNKGDEVKAGASIHIWLSFNEFVAWSRDGTSTHFSFDESLSNEIVEALSTLVRESFAPVFVNLCSDSSFFHGDEMPIKRTAMRLSTDLSRAGVPTTHSSNFWSERATFTNYKREAINPRVSFPTASNEDQWDSFAAFACMEKFLFREKMLFACTVGDQTIDNFETSLENVPIGDVVSGSLPEVSFQEPPDQCERISVDDLRKFRTMNPLVDVDFNAINPKAMLKEDRFWYQVPARDETTPDGMYQPCRQKMVFCSRCTEDKKSRRQYNEFDEASRFCPNCASNFCRKFYYSEHQPERAEIVLRWAASLIIYEKELSPTWGRMEPEDDIRAWMYETIKTFRTHPSGVGKFVSHFGTTRMNAQSAANAMYQGQGKQLTVERQQVVGSDGKVQDYFQFSYDHGNRMYSDYMKKLFSAPEITTLVGHPDPTEEVLGDCVEVCLGILRVAMMYEGHSPNIFKWKNIIGVLTGLEHSLLSFNASAFLSGLRNHRKANTGKHKGKSYTFDDCKDVPTDVVPDRRSPIVKNQDDPESADVFMSDATQTTTSTEGKGVGPAAPSTDADRSGPAVPPGEGEAKRRRITRLSWGA